MNYSILTQTELFQGITEEEILKITQCLCSVEKTYEKGELIYRCGEKVENMGLVLSGGVIIESDDIWGNCSVIGHIGLGQIFAETYACLGREQLLVNVFASEKTEILFVNAAKLLAVCPNLCAFHQKVVYNLLQISARKNLQLSKRILFTSPKSLRGKLMSFFSDSVKQTGSYMITVPFNRQQLADYLGVDRSAMCNELSKMQKDGLLSYHKNTFRLKEMNEKIF